MLGAGSGPGSRRLQVAQRLHLGGALGLPLASLSPPRPPWRLLPASTSPAAALPRRRLSLEASCPASGPGPVLLGPSWCVSSWTSVGLAQKLSVSLSVPVSSVPSSVSLGASNHRQCRIPALCPWPAGLWSLFLGCLLLSLSWVLFAWSFESWCVLLDILCSSKYFEL